MEVNINLLLYNSLHIFNLSAQFHELVITALFWRLISTNQIAELQKSCGYAGITHEEGSPYVKSLRKDSTFEISAKSAGTRE